MLCIEITDSYFGGCGGQLWVFLNTASDKFLTTDCGRHVFNREEIEEHPQAAELLPLLGD